MTKKKRGLLVPGVPAQITKLVESESDRGAILILGAYIDELLADLIRSSCVSDEAGEALLEFRRPAGDFSSRIDLCAGFGLIHGSEQKALHVLRNIRNAAAHFDNKGRGFDVLFDSDTTIAQVAELAKAVNLSLKSKEPEEVRSNFIICCRLLAVRVMFRSLETIRPVEPPTMKEIANAVRAHHKGTPTGERMEKLEEAIRNGDVTSLPAAIQEIVGKISAKLAADTQPSVPADNPASPSGRRSRG